MFLFKYMSVNFAEYIYVYPVVIDESIYTLITLSMLILTHYSFEKLIIFNKLISRCQRKEKPPLQMPKGTRLMMISSTRTTSVMILMARKGDDAEGRMRTLTTRRSFSLMNSCQAHSRSSELAFSASSSSTTRSGANSRCAPTALTAVVYRTLLTASRA